MKYPTLKLCLALLFLLESGAAKSQTTAFDEAVAAAGLSVVEHDFSDSDKIKVAEPRCAYVNITGTAVMPQEKGSPQDVWMEVYLGHGDYFRKRAVIDAQGNSSLAFEKKNFKADFCNDEWLCADTPEISIGDWVKHDSFHFKAYYTDWLRGAGAVALKFYDQIALSSGRPWTRAAGHIAKPKAKARCYPDGFPCIVYLNGKYYGIFAWQQKKHRDNMNQQKNVATHIHLDGLLRDDTFWKGERIAWSEFEVRNPKGLYCMDGTLYDGDHPRELMDETSPFFGDGDETVRADQERTAQVKHCIERLHSMDGVLQPMSLHCSADEIRREFEKYIDVTSLVDYACHHHVTANIDGFGKNWQWFTYDGEKWFVTPYDLDCTFGNHYSGNFVSDAQYTGTGDGLAALYPTGPVYWLRAYYGDEIKKRYCDLRQDRIIDTGNICGLIDDWYGRIGAANYSDEWQRWPDSKCISETIANDGWQLSGWADYFWLPTWNDSTLYDTGERVKLNYLVWEATAPSTGVRPWLKLGYTDSLERYKAWVTKRIALLDEHFGYSGISTYAPITETAEGKYSSHGMIYSLSGQRLNALRKGINIVGGRKVYQHKRPF